MPYPAERPNSADLIRGRTTVGDFELTILSDGTYFLDGGAMFGVVPKPLWEKRAPADDRNRIVLGLNTVIVRTGQQTIAIETGIGNKLGDKLRAIYGAKSSSRAPSLPPESVPKKSTSSSIPISTSTTADGTPRARLKVASSPPSPTPATSPIAAKSNTAICSLNATPSATSPTITIPSSNPAR